MSYPSTNLLDLFGKLILCCISALLLGYMALSWAAVNVVYNEEPKKAAVVEKASEFIGFDLGDSWQIKDWSFEGRPDFILKCTIVIPDDTYNDLIRHCETQGFTIRDSDDPTQFVEDAFVKEMNSLEEMTSLSVSVSREKPEVYFYHWIN